jgi:hypothetical protein
MDQAEKDQVPSRREQIQPWLDELELASRLTRQKLRPSAEGAGREDRRREAPIAASVP